MLQFRLDQELESIALTDDLSSTVLQVIQYFQTRGETARLIAAACESNPANAHLLEFAAQFGLAPITDTRIKRFVPTTTLDVDVWLGRLGAYEPRVCRVEIAPTNYGTGFLVGPDLAFTSYHVMERVIQQEIPPSQVALRFDFKAIKDRTTLNRGTVFRLGQDWLVDASPYMHRIF